MRVVKQYRTDGKLIVARSLTTIAALTCVYLLAHTSLTVFINKLDTTGAVHDEAMIRDFEHAHGSDSIQDQIALREDMLSRLRSLTYVIDEKRQLAALYELEGNKSFESGDLRLAEQSYQSARDFSPTNPSYALDLARLYNRAADSESDASLKGDLLQSARNCYADAMRKAKREDMKKDISKLLAKVDSQIRVQQPGVSKNVSLDLNRMRK